MEGGNFTNLIHSYFSKKSSLFSEKEFEDRPQQRDFSSIIYESITHKKSLAIEAGTGIGKSLGYLLPAGIHSLEREQKIIISTHTIHLQEQLLHQEIPKINQAFSGKLKVSLLKGRKNYICMHRLQQALILENQLFDSKMIEELKKIHEWTHTAKEGTLSEIPFTPHFFIWESICSNSELCNPQNCLSNGCFYQKAKQKINESNLIIVNHALLLSHLQKEKRDSNLIPLESIFLFDEAHCLPQVARDQFTITWSQNLFPNLLHRLYHPQKKKGLLAKNFYSEIQESIKETLNEHENFLSHLQQQIPLKENTSKLLHNPISKNDSLKEKIEELCKLLKKQTHKEEKTQQTELREIAKQLEETSEKLQILTQQKEKERAYWIKKSSQSNLLLNGSPIEVGRLLQSHLLIPPKTSIFISATLSRGKNDKQFQYFCQQLGENIKAQQIDSPFKYPEQMQIRIYNNSPHPKNTSYLPSTCQKIEESINLTKGKTLVLFTSYQTLWETSERMHSYFQKNSWKLLRQNKNQSRNQLLKEFREDRESVLFGVESFWSGVDILGESLSQVIITRLPFSTPDDPIHQAREKHLREKGGNPFLEISLPEAILKFRQGIGRLIRSRKDKGILTILDSRILNMSYGKEFQNALPSKTPLEILKN